MHIVHRQSSESLGSLLCITLIFCDISSSWGDVYKAQYLHRKKQKKQMSQKCSSLLLKPLQCLREVMFPKLCVGAYKAAKVLIFCCPVLQSPSYLFWFYPPQSQVPLHSLSMLSMFLPNTGVLPLSSVRPLANQSTCMNWGVGATLDKGL